MIKKTRLKFFWVISAITVLMIALLCSAILISSKIHNSIEARVSLEKTINAFEGSTEEGPKILLQRYQTYIILLDYNDNIIKRPISSYYTEYEVDTLVAQILNNDAPKYLLVTQKDLAAGKLIAWVNLSIDIDNFNSLTLIVLLIGIGSILMTIMGAWFLSFWIIKPIATGLEQQQRFISEASHEMKTPLTIITTGVELIQKQQRNTTDTNKWLDSIKTQTKKMTAMVADLFTLSGLNEKSQVIKTEFDLSQEVLKTVLTFESIAYEQSKDLVFDIDENITYKGNPNAVAQALTILCDNALKHSDKEAVVEVSLKSHAQGAILNVSNAGGYITEAEIPLLFERFYRNSESRTKTHGSGLGLAILKTLVEQNGWKIDVEVNSKKTTFSLTF